MNDVICKVDKIIPRTSDVTSFRVVPEKPVDFEAGQFLQVVFDEEDRRNKELNKFLSFSCAPGKGYIEFTKKLTGSIFSGRLRNLAEGDTLLIKCPMGKCVFNPDHGRLLFLAGGIGITPVISIIEHIVGIGFSADIVLVYANRSEADIAFRNELEEWAGQYGALRILHVLETGEAGGVAAHIGFIDADLLRSQVPDFPGREMYVFGPPAMVNAMNKVQDVLGFEPEQFHSETFMGY